MAEVSVVEAKRLREIFRIDGRPVELADAHTVMKFAGALRDMIQHCVALTQLVRDAKWALDLVTDDESSEDLRRGTKEVVRVTLDRLSAALHQAQGDVT